MNSLIRTIVIVVVSFIGSPSWMEAAEEVRGRAMIIFDGSGSMNAALAGETRVGVAKSSMATILPKFNKPGLELGLMIYGHRKKKDCSDIELAVPPAQDRAAEVAAKVAAVSPLGQTPLAMSIQQSGQHFLQRDLPQFLIVLTDGIDTCGGNPVEEARKLAAMGINVKVHVIGFLVGPKERKALEAIAMAGGGQYFDARDADGLNAALEGVQSDVQKEILGEAVRPGAKIGDVVFEDTFAREELGNDWSIEDEDDERWVMDEGVLVITQAAKVEENKETGEKRKIHFNTLKLTRELPKNYSIEAEWEIPFTYKDEKVGGQHLELVVDSGKSSVVVGMMNVRHGGGPYISRYFVKKLGDQENPLKKDEGYGGPGHIKWENPVQKVRLRLVKKKFDFTAYAQRTGQEWTELGTHKVLKLKAPRLLLRQWNDDVPDYHSGPVPEVEARIKEVVIKEVE